jgi:hypothetical protein
MNATAGRKKKNAATSAQTQFANREIVTIAVYLLGGSANRIDVEDIAVKVNELVPNRFTWRKYKDQINLDAVRKRLWDAKNQTPHLLQGSEKDGWMLTEQGLTFAQARTALLTPASETRIPTNQAQKKWLVRERARMLASDAYVKVCNGLAQSITEREAASFFRIDEYVSGAARSRKITRLVNSFRDDTELGPAIVQIAAIARGEGRNG